MIITKDKICGSVEIKATNDKLISLIILSNYSYRRPYHFTNEKYFVGNLETNEDRKVLSYKAMILGYIFT